MVYCEVGQELLNIYLDPSMEEKNFMLHWVRGCMDSNIGAFFMGSLSHIG